MNVYDFDKTIYHIDSGYDFYKYLVKKEPKVLLVLPITIIYAILYIFKIIDKTKLKEKFYSHLAYVSDEKINKYVSEYWETHVNGIFPYYLKQKESTDVVISASPYFLLKYICDKLGVEKLIATRVDIKTGRFTGKNCYGEEKVNRFCTEYNVDKEKLKIEGIIEKFYSDSKSDTPLAYMAKEAFIIDKYGKVHNWSFE